METWWHDHGGGGQDPAWVAYLADYTNLLATKIGELTTEHSNTGADGAKRFGMSGAAGCTRKAALKYMGYEGEPFTGSSLATFHIGHLLECMAVATLRACGYAVDGTQTPVYIDPFMHSASDAIIELDGQPTILSVKSAGYKKSGQQRGKWVRQGFPAYPFEGVRNVNPSAWCQAQAEMHGSGIERCLLVVVAKDIVKSMEKDPYLMGAEGNGSLTFYAEMIEYDPLFVSHELLPIWGQTWDAATDGRAGTPFVYSPKSHSYVKLPAPGDTEHGWGGANQAALGTFNYCFSCELAKACKERLVSEYRGGR